MAAPDYASEIAALEAAAASGELTVEADGERLTYRSIDALLSALTYFRNRAAENAAPAARRSTTTLVAFDRE